MSAQIKAALGTYARAFAAIVLGLFLANGADVFAVTAGDLRAWLAAGLAAVLPVAINTLNPADSRYGIGSTTAE